MSTTNTPLTDAAEFHTRELDIDGDVLEQAVVRSDFARALETRLHAAEELLREAWGWLPRECHYTSAKGVPTMLINNISRHFAAHLANATTTKETQT